MALTRKFLSAMGIESEKIDEIIGAHAETVEALKTEMDQYKEAAEKLPDVQKKLDEALSQIEDSEKDSYKVKYEALKEDFDSYKSDIKNKEVKAGKESAYRQLLKDSGVSEKRLDAIIKVSDIDSLKLVDGKLDNIHDLKKSIQEEWSDFIVKESVQGATTANPPATNGGSILTKDQIYARDEHGRYKLSAGERQDALRSLSHE